MKFCIDCKHYIPMENKIVNRYQELFPARCAQTEVSTIDLVSGETTSLYYTCKDSRKVTFNRILKIAKCGPEGLYWEGR